MADTVQQSEERTFGKHEEHAIISLAFDAPEFFSSVSKYIRNEHFKDPHARFIYVVLERSIKKHGIIPTREIIRDTSLKHLTVDDEYEPIVNLINRKSNPREVPSVKEELINFAKQRTYGLLYTQDVMESVNNGEYDKVEEIIEEARKITDVSQAGIWFFDRIQDLFVKDSETKHTTGFPKLDRLINDGGPTKGDVFAWMAPTNVGKTMILCNTGESNIRKGKNVLHISLEGDIKKIQVRYAGVFTNIPAMTYSHRMAKRQEIESLLRQCSTHTDAELVLYKFAADELDINTIRQTIEFLRRNKGFHPDVLIIDYLELMISRNKAYNKDDYVKQKAVATELCHLADKENITIFTATQTNRSGVKEEPSQAQKATIDLDKIAESFGKSMPLAYIVSMNQTWDEYKSGYDKDQLENTNARLRLYIAKNRNGPKSETVATRVNYMTMRISEEEPAPVLGV